MNLQLWDSLGLLHLHREEPDPNSFVRIFNAYKSEQADRQIGDRRGANALEGRVSEFGPSSRLPAGYDIAELSIDPHRESLVIYITDRKDFYHQFWVSDCKAVGNSLGPRVHTSHVDMCPSFAAFTTRYAAKNIDCFVAFSPPGASHGHADGTTDTCRTEEITGEVERQVLSSF